MHSDRSAATDETASRDSAPTDRRRFLALGVGLATTTIAGCSSNAGSGGSDGSDGGAGTDANTASATDADGTAADGGAFRLLISDQPVAIDAFDSLDVTLDRARIFRADDGSEPTATANETEMATGTETVTASPSATGTDTDTDAEGDGEDDSAGFRILDLDGATVDLTRVVGDRAITVFDGDLPEGRYAKVELYAEDVAGVVDGEYVEVTIPSGKLQLTKPFEVAEGERVDFVFDINVVERGRSGAYNLLPVISESGVAGQDVDVTEVGDRTSGGGADASEAAGNASGDGDSPPVETGGGS